MKDLTELAARKRTYIVRSAYALLLFSAFALFFMGEIAQRGLQFRLLGAGRDMLEFLIVIQLIGVYLFLPAMVAPCIAGEKERGTLGLLFTTDLGPWEILIQKYLSRLAPMFMFLLLSLPLMAVAYSYGGFSSHRLMLAAYVIFTTCMQIAAFALMWSAYSRTTSESTGAVYAGGISLFFLMGILSALLADYGAGRSAVFLVPVASVFPPMRLIGTPFGGLPAGAGILPWLWTALFLVLARRFLVTRAFKKKSKSFQRMMRDLGRFVGSRLRLTKSPSRDGRARRPAGDLPGREPVTWRELAGSSLRTPVGFVLTAGVLGLVLVCAAFLFVYWIGFDDSERGLGVSIVVFGVWVAGALAIAVKSASAFALERSNNTLDLLLVTPLTGREIVAGKAAAVRRRALYMFVILGALFAFEVIVETNWDGRGYSGFYRGRGTLDFGQFGYLLVSFLSVPIYLWMTGWLSGWIGLRLRKQSQATAIAFGAVFGICVVPLFLAPIVAELSGTYMGDGPQWIWALSPGTIVVMTEIANLDNVYNEVFGTHAAEPIALNFTLCAGIGLVFRRLCLANADRYLGRPVGGGVAARPRPRRVPVAGGVA
jgi:ABC-type transport system involved in multi-copper enzyme maturation permease subunit